jgi:CheY-like chemotaxis protein
MSLILVVDDDAAVRELILTILGADGHDAVAAPGGAIALRHLASVSFDLIVTDMYMPCTSGTELIAIVKSKFPRLPVLAITGGNGRADAEATLAAAKRLGVSEVLAKPFSPVAFLRKVHAALHCQGRFPVLETSTQPR